MQLLPPGKIAVVTGIGPGLGKEIALGLAQLKTKLAIGARSEGLLKEVADEIRAMGGEVIAQHTDLSDRASCQALVKACTDKFGSVDILVQNGHHAGDWALVEESDAESWRKIMDVNLFGAFHLFQACLPFMKAKKDGRVVFVNSGAGNNLCPPRLAAYGVSKAALAGLVRSIALEHGKDGIRCNGAHMGVMEGGNFWSWAENEAKQKGQTLEKYMSDFYDNNLPLRYVPTPRECAGSVIFLASDLARTMTGQAISVNGGQWFAK